MKKKVPRRIKRAIDDVQSECDFSHGERGKYAKTLREQGYAIRVYHADGTFTEMRMLGNKIDNGSHKDFRATRRD